MNTKKFLGKMTIEDKARLLCGTGPFSVGGFESAAGFVPELVMQDGGTGINHQHLFQRLIKDASKGYSSGEGMRVFTYFYDEEKLSKREKELHEKVSGMLTQYRGGIKAAPGCYPPGILLGATWNPKTVYDTGKALGIEAAVYQVGVLLGTPNCNLLREPLNGRFFEGYSEDPFLAKTLAPEMCKGVESMRVAANVKHFACNNLEINRKTINELIAVRALREIYFPAFEACSKVAATLMTAYPAVNGKFCSENSWLLKDVLRKEWGYEGVVMTDWEAHVTDSGDAVASGQNIFMPGPWNPKDIVKAVKDRRLAVKDLDEAALRVLELIDKHNGVKTPEGLTDSKYKKLGDKAAYNAASEGIVMLKNKARLPLRKNSKVVFFGPDSFLDCGGGSANVYTDRKTNLASELKKILGDGNVFYNDIDAFRNGALAIVIETVKSGEGNDRPDLKMNKKTVATIRKLAKDKGKGRICLILNVPGPVELGAAEEPVEAVFAVFYPGMMGGKAMADILTGKVNPSGALPCTFPASYNDTPVFLCYPDNLTCVYGEGIYTGYRGYHKRGIKPLYPFGFGLSYSKFKVSDISGVRKGDRFIVTCDVTNSGKFDGKAVIQLYVSKTRPRTQREPFKLIGFVKPLIVAGDKRAVTIRFDKKELAYFDEEHDRFLIEGGSYDLFLSLRGCEELIPAGSIYIADGSPELKCGFSWTIKQIAEVKELTDALKKDFEAVGFPYFAFTANLEYVPSMKLSELFPDTGRLKEFNRAAKEFREE